MSARCLIASEILLFSLGLIRTTHSHSHVLLGRILTDAKLLLDLRLLLSFLFSLLVMLGFLIDWVSFLFVHE